jgi:hypothetical protein
LTFFSNPGRPQACEIRAELDKTRKIWLRGHRDVFGFAYLTLGVAYAGVAVFIRLRAERARVIVVRC